MTLNLTAPSLMSDEGEPVIVTPAHIYSPDSVSPPDSGVMARVFDVVDPIIPRTTVHAPVVAVEFQNRLSVTPIIN